MIIEFEKTKLKTVDKILYKAGRKHMITVKIYQDKEAKVWIAINEEIGLTLESDSYEELVKRVQIATPEMAKENNVKCDKVVIVKMRVKKSKGEI